jgi:hypothetical protein
MSNRLCPVCGKNKLSTYRAKQCQACYLKQSETKFTADTARAARAKVGQKERPMETTIEITFARDNYGLAEVGDDAEPAWARFCALVRRELEQTYPGADVSFDWHDTGGAVSDVIEVDGERERERESGDIEAIKMLLEAAFEGRYGDWANAIDGTKGE